MSSFVNTPWARFAASLLIALVALEIGLPTGCIGFQTVVGVQRTEPKRELDAMAGKPGASWGRDNIRTPADALRVWGKPSRRKVLPGGREAWKYRTPYTKWRGGVVWCVLPVPVVMPTGKKKVWLEFAGDSLRSVRTQCTIDKAYGFFFETYKGKTIFGQSCQ